MRRLVAAAVAVVVLAGCGGGGDDRAMSRPAARTLHDQVASIEYAIAGENIASARQGLAQLRRTVARLVEDGQVTPDRAPEIGLAIEGVLRSLDQAEADAG